MARFRLVPEQSELWAEARSSLHPVRVHTTGLTGVVEAELGGEQRLLLPPTRVALEASRLRSGNGLVDTELQRRIDTATYPALWAELLESVPGARPDTLRLTGSLTFHGVTRSMDIEVTVEQPDATTLVLEGGRVIDMRDFALDPPRLLMFRMDPRVHVRARLVGVADLRLVTPVRTR